MEAMLQSWKDKAKKLSRFFSFRSLSLDRSQARSYSKKSKSSSSTDTSIRSSPILKAFTSQNSISDNKSINSTLPNNESDFSTKCDNKEAISASENSILDTTDQLNVKKPTPYLTEDSSLISGDLYEFLLSSLPNIVKGCQWTLLYSTVKHGISLRTLIRRSADLSGPCLLIVGDKQGAIFGGLLECPLRPTPKRKYQGTNQTSVFTTVNGEPRLFRPTGANRYFYMCLNDLLALGGGNFALCLDEDLLCGTSGACETFGNQCLAHSSEFEVKNVELWGFTHSSRYLT